MSRRKQSSAVRRRERREREKAERVEQDEASVRERAEQLATEADPWAHLVEGDVWTGGRGPAHRQVEVVHDGRSAYVDEGLSDLILGLWRLGLRDTVASCEAHEAAAHLADPPPAYVAFASRASRDWLATAIRAAGSEVVVMGNLEDALAAKVEADPMVAAEVYLKGAGWSVYWPAADVPAVADLLRRAEIGEDEEGRPVLYEHDDE